MSRQMNCSITSTNSHAATKEAGGSALDMGHLTQRMHSADADQLGGISGNISVARYMSARC